MFNGVLNCSISCPFLQEKVPLHLDGTSELIPLQMLKTKRFAEKFATENPQAFWYQDEKNIVSKPPTVNPFVVLGTVTMTGLGNDWICIIDMRDLCWLAKPNLF